MLIVLPVSTLLFPRFDFTTSPYVFVNNQTKDHKVNKPVSQVISIAN